MKDTKEYNHQYYLKNKAKIMYRQAKYRERVREERAQEKKAQPEEPKNITKKSYDKETGQNYLFKRVIKPNGEIIETYKLSK